MQVTTTSTARHMERIHQHTMSKDLPVGGRIMDRAYYRDKNDIEHTGEALVLACLLYVRKGRTSKAEEELKDVLNVYGHPEK